jgi:signal transduction histidine kinase
VPDEVREQLAAVVVEALSNVARHAGATHVNLEVRIEGDMVVAEVRDDGKGFSDHPRGNGLRNIRERARMLEGACVVISAPGEGTVIRWTVPLHGTDQ